MFLSGISCCECNKTGDKIKRQNKLMIVVGDIKDGDSFETSIRL